MKIKSHYFEDHGGEVIESGKPNWPDRLNISISRREIFRLIATLANALQTLDRGKIILNFMGKLDYDVEEE